MNILDLIKTKQNCLLLKSLHSKVFLWHGDARIHSHLTIWNTTAWYNNHDYIHSRLCPLYSIVSAKGTLTHLSHLALDIKLKKKTLGLQCKKMSVELSYQLIRF